MLDPKTRVILARHHHLLSSMVAGGSCAPHAVLDLSRARLRLAKLNIEDSLQRIGRLAKSARKTKVRAHFLQNRAAIEAEAHNLDNGINRFLRVAATADVDSRVDFRNETNLQWKQMFHDIKRIGVDKSSIEEVATHINAVSKLAKGVSSTGQLLFALNIGEASRDIATICRQYPYGSLCYKEGTEQTLGVGGAQIGASVGDSAGEAVCNLALDEETMGAGMAICKLIVPAASSLAGGYALGRLGRGVGIMIYKATHYIVHLGH